MTLTAETLNATQTLEDLQPALQAAADLGIAYLETTVRLNCHCGAEGSMRQTGLIATGLPIESPARTVTFADGMSTTIPAMPTYYPSRGEVLKNRWMECLACGFAQAS
jgi:hypothetical protein